MPCTVKKTFEIARQTGNDLIVQVKSNQKGLLRRLEGIVAATAPMKPMTAAILREIARRIGASKSMPLDRRSMVPHGHRLSPPWCASPGKP